MKKNYYIFIILFFILNIINTYFLTTLTLNRYIAPFNHTLSGELNSIIGNFSVLLLLYVITTLFFRKQKNIMRTLLVLTFFLNILIFISGVFNLYYGTAFSVKTLIMFKNPAGGFAMGIVKEVLVEFVKNYRFLVFLPSIILLIIVIRTKNNDRHNTGVKNKVFLFLSSTLLLSITFVSYSVKFLKEYNIMALESSYAHQNFGVYSYMLTDFLGMKFEIDSDTNDNSDIVDLINIYNKNKNSYTNFFTKEQFSNRLTKDKAVDNLYVDPSLTFSDDLHGILKNRNLVLVHLESFNYFLLENNYTKKQLPFLQALLDESFVFHEFYNNVGMGVSSDAEMAVLTGLNPVGDDTLYWEYDNKPYELDNLATLFNNANYYTKAIHGDYKEFYNREIIYPNLYNFRESYFLDDFIKDGYIVEDGYTYNIRQGLVHHSPWISDYHLADEVITSGNSILSKYFLYPVTMMGHTPYDYNPIKVDKLRLPSYYNKLNTVTKKYIDYTQYYDEIIKRYFVTDRYADTTLDNTVYIFYSDHGSGIKNGDLKTLFNKDFSILEQRKMLQRTLAFIYVPGTQYILSKDHMIRKGLLKGDQYLVRSEIDLYRTIVELFDLPINDHPYFGVHGLSKEQTFALENRVMDVALDTYFYSMRNKKSQYNTNINEAIYKYILNYKKLQDFILDKKDNQQLIIEKNRSQN
mgnify:CR=1 FL=1